MGVEESRDVWVRMLERAELANIFGGVEVERGRGGPSEGGAVSNVTQGRQHVMSLAWELERVWSLRASVLVLESRDDREVIEEC